ncbi:hypothetical protein BZG02_11625 [Labilibaculum filiforme]|uniref:Amidohydrolase-related domain-containing protein n=1 Tax=Labilibaculum filiforme TaxID=1940526 RepID=A0A2N3HXT2_9BACT|nr:amidohydrolase family protein [Labilibaculum filiforme]PKQ62837.1 hypothetical protein BZG02_11625 [Labilibaculum filiforme]
MRKIAANYIFPVTSEPLRNGIIILDSENKIVDLIDTKGDFKEISNLEFYSGVLIPGLVDVFTLLSISSFSKIDFEACLQDDFAFTLKQILQEKENTPTSVQKGINQLEAYGTVLAADYFQENNHANQKQKSKTTFRDINLTESICKLHLPIAKSQRKTCHSLFINRIILEKFSDFKACENEMNQCCIGTGSLGTHDKLSVFEEIKTLQEMQTNLTFWDLIKWGTINGARHLQLENTFGSLEIGKKPGLNLLSNLDYQNQKFTSKSELRVIA